MFSSVLPKNIEDSSFLNEGPSRQGLDFGKQLTPEKVLSVRLASSTSSWKRARQRPFIEEASRLQSEFGGAFSKYMEAKYSAEKPSSSSSSRTLCPAGGSQESLLDALPSKPPQDLEVLADNFDEGTWTATVKDASGIDMYTSGNWHWPLALKRSAKQRDKVGTLSLRTAMALPPLQGETRYHWREYRGVGASERSLLDRTPRTDPDCTRPAPPRLRSKSPPGESRSMKATFDESTLWTPFYGTPSMGLAHSGSSTTRLPLSSRFGSDEENQGSMFVPSSHMFDPLEASDGFSWKCTPRGGSKPSPLPLKTRGS